MNCTSWALFSTALWLLSVGKDGAQGPAVTLVQRASSFNRHTHRKGGNREMSKKESRNYLCPCGTLLEVPSLFLPFSAFEQRRPSQPDVGMNHPVLFYGKKTKVSGESLPPEALACTSMRAPAGAVRSDPPFLALV